MQLGGKSKLKVPPKIWTFLWKACSNCLPTRDNLRRKKVQVEGTCDFCRSETEIVAHIIWSCPFAKNVWALVKGQIQKCNNETEDFFLLFKHLQYMLEGEDLDRWATMAWAIWNSRNKFYFEHIQLEPRSILEKATNLITEYQALMATGQG